MAATPTRKNAATLCDDRILAVRCPNRAVQTQVTASRWRMTDGEWTSWKIVDCPLLEAGLIDCDMICLSQLKENLKEDSIDVHGASPGARQHCIE
jgi:hypothetical protein